MLACLKKDYYTILGYCRYLLFVIVLFTLLPYLSGDTKMGFYAVYPRLFAGMIPLTVYTYDEREHWCSTCATLCPRPGAAVSVSAVSSGTWQLSSAR